MKFKTALFIGLLSFAPAGCSKQTGDSVHEKNAISENRSAAENRSSRLDTPRPKAEKVTSPIDADFKSGLPTGWESNETGKVDRSLFSTEDGTLKLRIPGGSGLSDQDQTVPRLLKPISGDFELETKVKFDPKIDFQGAGLLIWVDAKNFLRLDRAFGESGNGVRFARSVNGNFSTVPEIGQNRTESLNTELKIVRRENEFYAFLRENIDSEWKEIGFVDAAFPRELSVGLSGVSTRGDTAAEFAYLRIFPVSN
ncbi:MAG: DUF1349 domain-containing protein [Pyrinomonadaceae bacterium]|nr:DUF1349 domain-containing protein [Pyrinomonadaceae bacterium]